MSKAKKERRQAFRDAVFARDDYTCRMCGARGVKLDAHHITPREVFLNGGYVLENGITLCDQEGGCHARAEREIKEPNPQSPYSSHKLYQKIGSNLAAALDADEKEDP